MPEALSQQIDRLQDILHSKGDHEGRAFVPLADAYRRAGDLDRALEVVSEGLSAYPDSASGHMVSGWLHRDRGEDDRAMRSFERVLELDDENGMALRSLTELAAPERGLVLAERLVELDPDDAAAVAALEGVRSALATSTEAEEQAEVEAQAEGAAMDEPAAVDVAVDVLPIEDLAPAVEREAQREAPPETPESTDESSDHGEVEIYTQTLAELYAKQGVADKAVEVYRKLLEDDPDNGMFLHRVAELTRGAGPAAVVEGAAVETDDRTVVPIESLAPDVEAPVADYRPVVPIATMAPDPVEPVQEPVVDVEDLAPEGEPTAVDTAEAAQDHRPVVPIQSLAPDASTEDPSEDPFPWMNKL